MNYLYKNILEKISSRLCLPFTEELFYILSLVLSTTDRNFVGARVTALLVEKSAKIPWKAGIVCTVSRMSFRNEDGETRKGL